MKKHPRYNAAALFCLLLTLAFWSICIQAGHSQTCTTVTTTADSGPGSLREAINCAKNNPRADTIRFNISGTGPHVIRISAGLVITDNDLVTDASTQPGWRPGWVVIDATLITNDASALSASNYQNI